MNTIGRCERRRQQQPERGAPNAAHPDHAHPRFGPVGCPSLRRGINAIASPMASSLTLRPGSSGDTFRMDEEAVREHAQGHIDALMAGDVGRALEDLSSQLRSQPGELMAMLPLPLTSAEIESVDMAGSGLHGRAAPRRRDRRDAARDALEGARRAPDDRRGEPPEQQRGSGRGSASRPPRRPEPISLSRPGGPRSARRALPREQPSAASRAPQRRCRPARSGSAAPSERA